MLRIYTICVFLFGLSELSRALPSNLASPATTGTPASSTLDQPASQCFPAVEDDPVNQFDCDKAISTIDREFEVDKVYTFTNKYIPIPRAKTLPITKKFGSCKARLDFADRKFFARFRYGQISSLFRDLWISCVLEKEKSHTAAGGSVYVDKNNGPLLLMLYQSTLPDQIKDADGLPTNTTVLESSGGSSSSEAIVANTVDK